MKIYSSKLVTYEQARKEIKNGDIVFVSHSNTLMGKLIALFTDSPIFHVGIACWMTTPTGKRILCSCEQWYGGRRIVNLRTYSNCSLIVMENPVEDFHVYMDELILNTGEDYSIPDFVGAGLYDLAGIKLKNSPGEICSELVMRIVNHAKGTALPVVISPAKLFDTLTKVFEAKITMQTEIEK